MKFVPKRCKSRIRRTMRRFFINVQADISVSGSVVQVMKKEGNRWMDLMDILVLQLKTCQDLLLDCILI